MESTFLHVNTFRFFPTISRKFFTHTLYSPTNFLFTKAVAMTNHLVPHIPQAEMGTGEQAMELLRELLPPSIVVLLAAIANKGLWQAFLVVNRKLHDFKFRGLQEKSGELTLAKTKYQNHDNFYHHFIFVQKYKKIHKFLHENRNFAA